MLNKTTWLVQTVMTVLPWLVAWAILILYQKGVERNELWIQVLAFVLFRIAKVATSESLQKVFEFVLEEQYDTASVILAISIATIIDVSFQMVALGASSWLYTAIAILLDVASNVYISSVVLGYMEFTSQRICRMLARILNPDSVHVTRAEEKRLLDKDRTYMTMKLLGTEVFELIVPLGYMASVVIIANGPNNQWMAGIGRSIWHYTETYTSGNNIALLVTKVSAFVVIDAILLAINLAALTCYRVRIITVLSVTCREYGSCLAFILAFMIYHQFCITAIGCGMDFTFKFEWLFDPAVLDLPEV